MDMKPVICPYCGREMELDDRCFPGYGFWYTCECGASGPICKSEEEAYQYANPSAQPKWISVIDNPPNEGDVVFAHDPDEGWIALVKVIRVNLASIDVKAIWPEHSPPFVAKVWMPLRFPEPTKEE